MSVKLIAVTDDDVNAREALEVYLNEDTGEIFVSGFYDSVVSMGQIKLNSRDLAPDMYRALRELLEDSEAAYLDKDKTDAARAALAKAEGRG